MDERDDGGSTFPMPGSDVHYSSKGLTVRDWFAGRALEGMLAADGNDPRWTAKDTGPDCQPGGGKWLEPAGVARQAYAIADAMIAARKHP